MVVGVGVVEREIVVDRSKGEEGEEVTRGSSPLVAEGEEEDKGDDGEKEEEEEEEGEETEGGGENPLSPPPPAKAA